MMYFHPRARTLTAIAIVSLLGLTACGGSPSAAPPAEDTEALQTYKKIDGLDDSTRMDELVKAAEAEGTLTAYLRSDDVFAELEKTFEAKYNIDLKIVNPGRVSVVRQQVLEQAKAGKLEADVVETYTHELNTMYAESGVLAETPKFLAALQADKSLNSQYAVETIQYPFLPVWNTNKIKGDDVPKGIADFTSDAFGNNMIMPTGNEMWYMMQFQSRTAAGMSAEDFEKLFKEIASRSNTADSNNPAAAGIASGQYTGGIGVAMVSAQRIGKDAPLAIGIPTEPTVAVPAGVALTSDAPHPAAALLFEHWYLTEGLDILAKEMMVSQSDKETDLPGVDLIRPDVTGLDGKKIDEWRVAYDNLIKGGDKVLPDYVKE